MTVKLGAWYGFPGCPVFVEGTVVRKEEISVYDLFDLGDGQQAPGFKQLSITPVLDGDIEVRLPDELSQHRREHQIAQGRGEEAALFDSVCHLERHHKSKVQRLNFIVVFELTLYHTYHDDF